MSSKQNLSRSRATKQQKEELVECLHSNLLMARGNTADPVVQQFWAELAMTLNTMGCQRTVDAWQHTWEITKSKIKTKARKIRDHIQRTGGGPGCPGLTPIEEKVLDVIGPSSVHGFADEEQGLREVVLIDEPSSPAPPQEPSFSSASPTPSLAAPPLAASAPRPSIGPSVHRPSTGPTSSGARTARTRSAQGHSRPHLRNRPRYRPPRPPASQSLIEALNDNSTQLRSAIESVGAAVALAIRESASSSVRAAQIIAAALRGQVLEEIEVPENN